MGEVIAWAVVWAASTFFSLVLAELAADCWWRRQEGWAGALAVLLALEATAGFAVVFSLMALALPYFFGGSDAKLTGAAIAVAPFGGLVVSLGAIYVFLAEKRQPQGRKL